MSKPDASSEAKAPTSRRARVLAVTWVVNGIEMVKV